MTAIGSLCLGGGTHSGFLSDALLQLLAIPLLMISIRRCFLSGHIQPSYWWDLALCVLLAAIPILQIIPLPPAMWAKLPSRSAALDAFTLTGQTPGWMPLSLLPDATISAALSLIPPFALFWGPRQLSTKERRYLTVAILMFVCISVFFGMAQLAAGHHSRLRPFEVTNPSSAVGFFANGNHFAALLYVAFLFASAWAIDTGLTIVNTRNRDNFSETQVVGLLASATLMFLLAAAQVMTRSRAGFGLTLAAFLAVALLTIFEHRNKSRKATAIFFAIAVVAVLLFTAQLGLSHLADRLMSDPLQDARIVFAQNTIEAAKAYFPFGSGVGTFTSVYPLFEKPGDLIANVYANHAHDDFLEIWLEAGAAGIAVVLLFAFWVIWRSIKVWFNPDPWNLAIDNLLARVATIAIGFLGIHSLVEYPLRTSALMSLMAVSCALLTPVPPGQRVEPPSHRRTSRQSEHKRKSPPARRQEVGPIPEPVAEHAVGLQEMAADAAVAPQAQTRKVVKPHEG